VVEDQRHASTLIDPLTRVAHRRTMLRYLRRHPEATIAIADIDWMKQINDFYGMRGGDAVLVETARRLRAEVQWPVLLARWGGEEFAAIFPALSRDAVLPIAERMRLACEAPVLHEIEKIPVSISIGIGGDLRSAEDRLYDAKAGGRNRVA
jgi:diguanylate cyclase (GGDEF)-like protein